MSLVGKSAQTSAECNKLIMVSRVPGYGQLEYLVLEYHVNLNMLLLINVVGFNCSLNWDRNAVNHSQCFTTTMIVK